MARALRSGRRGRRFESCLPDFTRLCGQLLIKLFYPAGTVWMDMDDTIFHRTEAEQRK